MKLFLFGIFFLAGQSESIAATYECTAVDRKATVASTQSVSVTSDTSGKTCSFSVNGASTGKQPMDASSVLRSLIGGSPVFSGNDRVRALAILLGAASPGGLAIDEMRLGNSVRNRMNDLESCVNEFRRGGDRSFEDNSNGLSCVVRGQGRRSQSAGATVTSDEPVLEISFRMDRQVHQVFLPASQFGRRW